MRTPLWLGVHEAAHAIAKFTLDELLPYPGPYLESVTVRREGNVLGSSKSQFRQLPIVARKQLPAEFHPDMIRKAEFDVIETLAGPAAEARQRGGRLGLFLLEDTAVREVLAADPQAGADDVHRARWSLDWIAPADRAGALRDLWHRAILLTEIEFPGIVAMGRLLCAVGEIEGDAFEAAWRDCRPGEAVRKQRARAFSPEARA